MSNFKNEKATETFEVLYLNPLSDPDYNKSFADSLKQYKYDSTSLDVACFQPTTNLPKTLDNLGFRPYEGLVIEPIVQVARLGSIANPKKKYDAMVIGCFYDPALIDSRTISGDMAVIVPCQASCQIAVNVSNKFSIIIGMDYWEDQMRETVYNYGYRDHLVSFEILGIPADQLPVDPTKTLAAIKQAAVDAVNKGAESIVLGCTLETGTFSEVETYLQGIFNCHIPVIDPSIAALKTAEHMAMNKGIWSMSHIHGMQQPSEGDLKKFGIYQTPYVLSNIINEPAKVSELEFDK
ncbi:aspartate/glutamate racemase family protein [Tenacibaculum xiamenense]|uniref:aspartate/glutamate racemase family protein n=1 Tax=Tenacibaculum xiamenense TaxID=1261553 RepID=UPI0038939561